MPAYDKSGFGPPIKLLMPGTSAYLWGSFLTDESPTLFQVINTAITTNVATITGYVRSGRIPIVGELISVRGVASAAAFNVTAVAITAVSINATTGQGTISYAATNANIGPTPEAGMANIPRSEVGETMANGASAPVAVVRNELATNIERTIQAVCSFPTIPTTATVVLQGALKDIDSEYFALGASTGTIGTVATGSVSLSQANFTLQNVNFVRALTSGLVGSGSLIVKVV